MRPLAERLRDVPQIGELIWVGVRSAHGEPMTELLTAELSMDRGIVGDVAARARMGGNRQVTLLQAEHLPVLAALTGSEVIPRQLRRNLLVARINLLALHKLEFHVGDEVVLRGTGPCAPCSKMDVTLGAGGFQAMRGHGGITAQVVVGGRIRVGDRVWV